MLKETVRKVQPLKTGLLPAVLEFTSKSEYSAVLQFINKLPLPSKDKQYLEAHAAKQFQNDDK